MGQSYLNPGATAFDVIDGTLATQVAGTVNPSVARIYPLSYTATDTAGNTSMPDGRTVTVVPEFEYAMKDVKGLSGNDALPDADHDHDGFANLQEFAFGLDPTSPGGQMVRSEVSEGMLRIRFLRRSGVTYSVESSDNLTDWTGGVSATPGAVQAEGIPEGYIEYEAEVPISGGRTFMRVGVSISGQGSPSEKPPCMSVKPPAMPRSIVEICHLVFNILTHGGVGELPSTLSHSGNATQVEQIVRESNQSAGTYRERANP